jgi:hypothetical protein
LKVHLPEPPEILELRARVREQQSQEEEEEERKQEEEAKIGRSPEMNSQPTLTLLKI